MSEEAVIFNLELNVDGALDSSRQVEMVIFRALGLWGRVCRLLGLPENSPAVKIVAGVQKLVMIIRGLHTAAVLLEAASGPLGWAKAGLSVASAVMLTASTMTSLGE